MKFYLIAGALLLAVLGGLAVLSGGSPSSVPATSSGSDDSSMKTLKIE